MKKIGSILVSLLLVLGSFGQVAPLKYFVEFMDKNNSPYSINRPQEFLSARAIERRTRQGIGIMDEDIPVNQSYVNTLRAKGADVLARSKWFNGVIIYCLNPAIVDTILQLPFVKNVYKSSFISASKPKDKLSIFKLKDYLEGQFTNEHSRKAATRSGYDYGPSFTQVHMLNGDSLHRLGYHGEGMMIAILDAGFKNADTLPAFDSLHLNNQVIATKDIVLPGNNVYNENEHGMEVLSCMGGNLPGWLVGTAPKAKYLLIRTEDVSSENIIEEYNWVTGAEFADSAGADIINSSLGYTTFDNPLVSHTCSDMSGNTTPVTRGANIAFSRGMIVVNSAGNEGGKSWHCVSAPSDGYSVISVAAVDANRVRASFSSTGEATHRIKPNVAAMGSSAVVSSTVGTITFSSGTSFSSPILAGMVACLWQALPSLRNTDILRAIELSASQASDPDSLLGYGIPDFVKAMQIMGLEQKTTPPGAYAYPNPFTRQFDVRITLAEKQDLLVQMADLSGRVIRSTTIPGRAGDNIMHFGGMEPLAPGQYLLRIIGQDVTTVVKVVKSIN